jgi:hypothetical protein
MIRSNDRPHSPTSRAPHKPKQQEHSTHFELTKAHEQSTGTPQTNRDKNPAYMQETIQSANQKIYDSPLGQTMLQSIYRATTERRKPCPRQELAALPQPTSFKDIIEVPGNLPWCRSEVSSAQLPASYERPLLADHTLRTGVPNRDSDRTDEYGFPTEARLKIYVNSTKATTEEVKAAVLAAVQAQLHVTIVKDVPKRGGPRIAMPAQAFIATAPSYQLFTLFEHPTLTLNIGGTNHKAVILRPIPSPSNTHPAIKVMFAGPDRPTTARTTYLALQELVIQAQHHNRLALPLSPLVAALDPTSIKLTQPDKTGSHTIAYIHLAHSQAGAVLQGLTIQIPNSSTTVYFRPPGPPSLATAAQHTRPLRCEATAIQLKTAASTRKSEVDLYIAELKKDGISFHPEAAAPYQVAALEQEEVYYSNPTLPPGWRTLCPAASEPEAATIPARKPTRPFLTLDIYPATYADLRGILHHLVLGSLVLVGPGRRFAFSGCWCGRAGGAH